MKVCFGCGGSGKAGPKGTPETNPCPSCMGSGNDDVIGELTGRSEAMVDTTGPRSSAPIGPSAGYQKN